MIHQVTIEMSTSFNLITKVDFKVKNCRFQTDKETIL